MTEIMPSLQNLIKLSYDAPAFRRFSPENFARFCGGADQGVCQYGDIE